MSEHYKCEKCQRALPVGENYVWIHVQIADKPAGDYRLHVDCFKKSLKENSSLFDKITVVELMKHLKERADHGN